MTLYVPAAVGVPVMTPLAALIARPGGRPLAEYVSGSPFGSLAEIATLAATPTVPLWLPGEPTLGTTAVLSAAATLTRTILATDGTPVSSMTNIIHMPGGTSEARPGICTLNCPPCALNGRSTKRWSMFQPCVTEPLLTKVTRATGRLCVTLTCTVRPVSTTVGAVAIVGRTASVRSLLNR